MSSLLDLHRPQATVLYQHQGFSLILTRRTCPGFQKRLKRRSIKGDSGESAVFKAARLLKQQQEIAAELAQLQEDVKGLTPEEQEELGELLKASLQTPSSPLPEDPPEAPGVDPRQYRRPAQEDVLTPEEYVELPEGVQKLLEGAGVLQALQWDGRPAKAPKNDEPDASKLSELKEFVMNAGRAGQQGQTQSGVGGGIGDRIPLGPQDEDDEFVEGDDEEFVPGEGVAELVAALEAGQPLPDDPAANGVPFETTAEFTARIEQLRHAYEAQFLDRKDWKISVEDFNRLWGKGQEEQESQWAPGDITDIQAAPQWPAEIQAHYDRFQWVLFLLRKAYMQPQPDRAAAALIDAGLAAEEMIYRDPIMESVGPHAWLDYTQRMRKAGGRVEVGNVWGHMSEDRPEPRWCVFVDLWLSLPYPDWYKSYITSNPRKRDPVRGEQEEKSEPQDPWAAQEDLWEPPPLRFPKGQPEGSPRRPRNPARAKKKPSPSATQNTPLTQPSGVSASLQEDATKGRGASRSTQGAVREAEKAGDAKEESSVVFTMDRKLPGEEGGSYGVEGKTGQADAVMGRLAGFTRDRSVKPSCDNAPLPKGPDSEKGAAGDGGEEEKEEEAVMDRLSRFTWDRLERPSHEGSSLPGEGEWDLLDLMRACQSAVRDGDQDEAEEEAAEAEGAESSSSEHYLYFHTISPWRAFQYATPEDNPWEGPAGRRRRKRRLEHNVVWFEEPENPEMASAAAYVHRRPRFGSLTLQGQQRDDATGASEGRGELEEQEITWRTDDGLATYTMLKHGTLRHQRPRMQPASLHLAEEEMPQWKGGAEKGQAWRDGNWFCIPMTVCHGINNAQGKVDNVQTLWGGMLGHSVGDSQDLVDLYARQLQLYEDHDPCRQRILPGSMAMSSPADVEEKDQAATYEGNKGRGPIPYPS